MESKDGVEEIDRLERGLLVHRGADSESAHGDGEEPVLYTASFGESEEEFIKYQSVRWVIYSLLLILAWGIGLLMLVYFPVRRYILRKDIRSRQLYVTPDAIIYKVIRPVQIPCFGNLKKEKYILLHSVSDVIIEQGYLQSLFGVYSVRIENIGVRRPPSDDIKIQGVANPHAFRKAVLTRLSNMRSEYFSRQISTVEDVATPKFGHSSVASMSPLRHASFAPLADMAIWQKLEEVGSSVKRVQTMMEEQNPQTLESRN